MALNVASGTAARRRQRDKKKKGTGKKHASSPNEKKGTKKGKPNPLALNPPFDARMRRIGSPLNMSTQMKRGWLQSEDRSNRINFLFNPSQLDLSHGVNPDVALNAKGKMPNDPTSPWYTSSSSAATVKLLFDRTYELFSAPRRGTANTANRYGVFADVAAFYVFLGMLPDMPRHWEDTLLVSPPQLKTAYLFVGPRQVYYGWVNNLSVSYSHWTQFMIPSRCSIDLSFTILPHKGAAPYRAGDVRQQEKRRGWGTGDLPEHGGIPSTPRPTTVDPADLWNPNPTFLDEVR